MKKKIYKFKNGATIIYKKRNAGNATALYAGFYCGANYTKNGLPHFFEHMLFKGTQKRTKEQILEDRNNITFLNASTFDYYMAVKFYESNRRIDKCFEMASDVLLNSKFEQEYIDKEADVILEEAKSDVNSVKKKQYWLHYNFISNKFDTLEDYSNYWFGTSDYLKSLKTQDFIDFRDKHFVSDKFFVSVASHLPFYKIKRLVKKYFLANIKNASTKSEIIPFKQWPIVREQSINLVKNNEDVFKVVLSIKMDTPNNNYRYDYNFDCISRTIFLRKDMFVSKSRDNGYIYNADSFNYYNYYADNMAYVFSFVTSKFENLEKIFDLIGDTIKILKTSGLSETDINNYKEAWKVSEDKPKFISYDAQANDQLFLYYRYGKEKSKPKNFSMKCVEKITSETIKSNIEKCFDKNNDIHITIMGNVDEEKVKSVEEYKALIFKD